MRQWERGRLRSRDQNTRYRGSKCRPPSRRKDDTPLRERGSNDDFDPIREEIRVARLIAALDEQRRTRPCWEDWIEA